VCGARKGRRGKGGGVGGVEIREQKSESQRAKVAYFDGYRVAKGREGRGESRIKVRTLRVLDIVAVLIAFSSIPSHGR
jgi:hypothetical protein